MVQVRSRRQRWSVMVVVTTVVVLAMLSGCDSAGAKGGGGNGGDSGDPGSYTVSYEANGENSGTAPDDETKTHGVELTLANNSGNLARTGHSFAGWNTTDSGSGTDYAEGATHSTDADVMLYAKWTANTYTVSFNLQGGTGWSTSVTVTFGQSMPAAIAPTKADAGFWGYHTGLDGTGTQYYTAAMESTRDWDIPADIELIAYWMQVGGTGPAGGVVFYDKGEYTDGWRFLEAWTADEAGTYYWKTDVTTTAGTSTAVGSGYWNTYSWMTGTKHPAAEVVRNATHGGYNDWFLPSKDELHEMYSQRGVIGSFASRYYWSSSESSANYAWEHDFHDGNPYGYGKMHGDSVRAARRF